MDPSSSVAGPARLTKEFRCRSLTEARPSTMSTRTYWNKRILAEAFCRGPRERHIGGAAQHLCSALLSSTLRRIQDSQFEAIPSHANVHIHDVRTRVREAHHSAGAHAGRQRQEQQPCLRRIGAMHMRSCWGRCLGHWLVPVFCGRRAC